MRNGIFYILNAPAKTIGVWMRTDPLKPLHIMQTPLQSKTEKQGKYDSAVVFTLSFIVFASFRG
jgi:hypothetical protein